MSEERYCPVCGLGTSVMCIHMERLVDAILYGVDEEVPPSPPIEDDPVAQRLGLVPRPTESDDTNVSTELRNLALLTDALSEGDDE